MSRYLFHNISHPFFLRSFPLRTLETFLLFLRKYLLRIDPSQGTARIPDTVEKKHQKSTGEKLVKIKDERAGFCGCRWCRYDEKREEKKR